MPKAYANIPEGQVSYRMEGSGEPLLLLHQTPMASEYSQMIPILAKSYRVIAMETLGYGYSDNPPREYEVEDFAKSVANFLSAIGINKASIVGHHTGSSIAVEVAASYPDRVDKLIISGVPLWEPERWEQYFVEVASHLKPPAEDGLFLLDWWNLLRNFSSKATPEFLLKPVALIIDGATKPYDVHNAVARHKIKERVSLIKSPTLFISGSEDMFLDKLDALQSLVPRSKTLVIEGGGVLICFEKPDEFAQAIIDFMKNPGV